MFIAIETLGSLVTRRSQRGRTANKQFHAKAQRWQRRKEEQIGLDFASLPPLRLCVKILAEKTRSLAAVSQSRYSLPLFSRLDKSVISFVFAASCVVTLVVAASAQNPAQSPETTKDPLKKANVRSAEVLTLSPEPFDGASVEKMAAQCVSLETEAGIIEIEMMPEIAPESVRNFLNLAATGALDTTTFSRVIKNFVIQGGNLSTSEKWGPELSKRAQRKLPDEPGLVKHVRGIVSMARSDEPNSASTHFFILVGDGPHLNGKFAAFGRVSRGLEIADSINSAETDGDKPVKPVRINRAIVTPCPRVAT
jgi:peptidyl-prolyl cis-trans isomerase B (cyclophilin B)